jgi:acetyl esterase/lipase
MPDQPPYLQPFVLDPTPVEPLEADGADGSEAVDLYLPGPDPAPAVVLVHGGPVSPDVSSMPRQWPVFRGYGSLLARAGIAAAMFDHRFHHYADLPESQRRVEEVVDLVRARPEVDPDRVVVWFFSGGGLLTGPWLCEAPSWLRGVAMTYPALGATPDEKLSVVSPAEAVCDSAPPLLVTRVGHEREELAGHVAAFLARAAEVGAGVDVIDVPDGRHGFDHRQPGRASAAAVREALTWAQRVLDAPQASRQPF